MKAEFDLSPIPLEGKIDSKIVRKRVVSMKCVEFEIRTKVRLTGLVALVLTFLKGGK